MRIAVACDGLQVAPFFVQCTSYMCYTVDCGVIRDSRNMPALDQPIEDLAELLCTLDVDTLIVGLIEYDMASTICRKGIEVVAGAEGDALAVAQAYVSKALSDTLEPCSLD